MVWNLCHSYSTRWVSDVADTRGGPGPHSLLQDWMKLGVLALIDCWDPQFLLPFCPTTSSLNRYGQWLNQVAGGIWWSYYYWRVSRCSSFVTNRSLAPTAWSCLGLLAGQLTYGMLDDKGQSYLDTPKSAAAKSSCLLGSWVACFLALGWEPVQGCNGHSSSLFYIYLSFQGRRYDLVLNSPKMLTCCSWSFEQSMS